MLQEIVQDLNPVDQGVLKLLEIKVLLILLYVVRADLQQLLLEHNHVLHTTIVHNVDAEIIDHEYFSQLLVYFVCVYSIDVRLGLFRDVLLGLAQHALVRLVVLFLQGAVMAAVYCHRLGAGVQELVYVLAMILPAFDIYKVCDVFVLL